MKSPFEWRQLAPFPAQPFKRFTVVLAQIRTEFEIAVVK
jgi:hypothetical protein